MDFGTSNKPEYETVGTMWLRYNQSYNDNSDRPIFEGVYKTPEGLVGFAVWKRASYDEAKPNDILATGKDDAGNAVFLRRSNRTNIAFFGSIVEQVSRDELGSQLYNFTIFDGDNSSAWAGTVQVPVGGFAAPTSPPSKAAPKTPSTKDEKKKKVNIPY